VKKLLCCGALIAGALVSANAFAQAYVTVAAGGSTASFNCTKTYLGATISCDEGGFTYKVMGGYEFDSRTAFEAAFVNVPGVDYSSYNERFHTRMLVLNAAYRVPLSRMVSIPLRIGAARVRSQYDMPEDPPYVETSETRTIWSPYVGLGVTVSVFKFVMVEVGVDFARAEVAGQRGVYKALTAGARFHF
jgi:hypothetical protein